MTVKRTCTIKTKFKDAHKNPVPEMLNSLMNEKDQNTWVMRLCYLTKTLHPSFTLIIKPKCLAHGELPFSLKDTPYWDPLFSVA